MRYSQLAFGLLWSGINARPHSGYPATTALEATHTQPTTSSATSAHIIRQRSVEAGDADPDDLIYEDTPNDYVFEIGYKLVDKLNEIGSDSCSTSEDDCQAAVEEVLNALPETGNYFVRSNDTDNNEPRQLSAIVGAEVAVVGYMLHTLFSEPEPKLIHVSLDHDSDDKGPIEISLPKANFPESITGTETTTTDDIPFEKYVLISTPIATNEKLVSAVSSALVAIATEGPVVPAISDYGQALPGWFRVNATLEQQLEIALIPGVEYVIDGLGPIQHDVVVSEEDMDDLSSVRRSVSNEARMNPALAKRGTDSKDLPTDVPDDHGACLRFASWGDGMQSAPEYYAYQEKQGQDYPIYCVELGFDLSHDEFADARADYPDDNPQLEQGQPVPADLPWFNGQFEETDMRTSLSGDPIMETEHGTSMLSVLMGKTVGILPQSRPILVRHGLSGNDWEPSLRNIASHIEQRQLTRNEKRSPIVAMASSLLMYESDDTPNEWPYSNCVWAHRAAGHFKKLVDLGATVVIAAANYDSSRPVVPEMNVLIALGLGQPCWDQHGVNIPEVPGMHVVSAVDTVTRRSLRNNDVHPYYASGIELAGPWACPSLLYDGSSVVYDDEPATFRIHTYSGTSVATYWTVGVLADVAYQAEDKGNLPDSPLKRSQALVDAAKQLMWTQDAPDQSSQQAALWNGLRRLEGRNETSTATSMKATPIPSTSSVALDSAPTSSSPPPPPPQDWESGWCGIHVKQKVYNSRASALTVTIKDATKEEIGGDEGDGPNLDYGQSHDVSSKLPLMMIVTAPGPDEPVNFAYGSQTWNSDDVDGGGNKLCSVGKWDGGFATRSRQMDCGFSC